MIFLIIQHDFDNMENSNSMARESKILGYTTSREEATEVIKPLKKNTYKGWNGESYPFYQIQETEAMGD